MDKEALLNIISSDIKEIEILINSFKDKEDISNSFIELSELKVKNLSEEIGMLRSFTNDTKNDNHKESLSNSKPINIASDIQEETIPVIHKAVIKNINSEKTNTIKDEDINISKEVTIDSTAALKQDIHSVDKTSIDNKISEDNNKHKVSNSHQTLGEKLLKEQDSLNSKIFNNENTKPLLGKPITDLNKGLSINDRFLYQRELFNGDTSLMTKTLSQLNEMSNFIDAVSFLKTNFSWKNETLSNDFYNYVHRKFQ